MYGTPLQYSCLENPMDGGAWWAAVHGVAKSWTRLSDFFHFSLSCIGEGNGNPLQCSCLENPRDGGAWWAAVYGVARSRTRLKRLSSSSMYLFELFKLKRNLNNSCFIYPVLWLEIQLFEENLPKKCFHLPWTKKGEQTKTPTCDATDVLCWAAQKHFFLLIKIF